MDSYKILTKTIYFLDTYLKTGMHSNNVWMVEREEQVPLSEHVAFFVHLTGLHYVH